VGAEASEYIQVTRQGAVAQVTINRPDRLNAFSLAMWARLGDAVSELAGDSGLRCLVLRGAGGKAFAAGADIAEFGAVRSSASQAAAYAEVVDRAIDAVRDCPCPTVALIEGACVGGGLELAVHCDLRLSNASGRYGIPINRLGHCLPYGAMVTLVELAGRATALEILLEGRVFSAEEAYAKALVTRVVPDEAFEAEAAAMVRRIADGAPLAARWHKQFATKALHPENITEEEWAAPFESCDTEDCKEGVRAFLAKEKPRFSGR